MHASAIENGPDQTFKADLGLPFLQAKKEISA